MTSEMLLESLKSLADPKKIERQRDHAKQNGWEWKTCDTIKAGEPDREVKKVAVSMFATVETIQKAVEWGADLLIVHEPTFYVHTDDTVSTRIGEMKRKLVEESGLSIFRFHDHAHAMVPDLIYEGETSFLGLSGERIMLKDFALNRFLLDEPVTAGELAKRMEDKLGLHHVRIAGATDRPGRLLSCAFGTPGNIARELEECDFVLTGEICEWAEGEMARDWAALGYNKAILVMTHEGSERAGMELLAKRLPEMYPELEAEYIECGELYHYTDGQN